MRRDHDTLPKALQPFSRALAIHDALPDCFRPSDATPLRECLSGVWPTVADLRSLVEWGTETPSPQSNLRASEADIMRQKAISNARERNAAERREALIIKHLTVLYGIQAVSEVMAAVNAEAIRAALEAEGPTP